MKIKLVIWDLDETFWKGTLSEGDVTPIQNNIELVKLLSFHGIINSISSKNDFEKAKARLEEMGVWDYFVFPVINWNPKGENVRDIVHNCQLRNPNVVFIDDNPSNCREVEHYNEGITTFNSPEEMVVNWKEYKDDPKLERLNQYKILEKKAEFRISCSDNTDFLRQSKIRVSFIEDYSAHLQNPVSRPKFYKLYTKRT